MRKRRPMKRNTLGWQSRELERDLTTAATVFYSGTAATTSITERCGSRARVAPGHFLGAAGTARDRRRVPVDRRRFLHSDTD